MIRKLATALGVVVAVACAQPSSSRPASKGYSAALYSSGEQSLTLFPLNEEASSIHLPFAVGHFTFSADGKVLYAEGGGPPDKGSHASPLNLRRVSKIEFNPIRVSPVEGSAGLSPIHSMAISRRQDKLMISGQYHLSLDGGCGIFEINLSDGKVRKVLDNPACLAPGSQGYFAAWLNISLSPDGQKAVAIRKHRLELLDLTRATVRALGDDFVEAAWSPDGKWIAALRNRGDEWTTVLMGTSSFIVRRIIGNSDVKWSPDSRYLLAGKEDDDCEDSLGTLEAVDIENGKRTTIDSSKCKINEVTTAWVSNGISR